MDLPAFSSICWSMGGMPERGKRSRRGYKGIFMSLLPRRGRAAKAWGRKGSSWRQTRADAGFPPKRMLMTTSAKTKTHASADYVVKDIGLAEWGRKEIAIAET